MLRFVTEQFAEGDQKIYLDMEVELRLFQDTIKPDYQVMKAVEAENRQKEPNQDIPLYAIEVKRTDRPSKDLKECLD